MNTDMVFGKLPSIESLDLEINKIEETNVNEVYSIYSNDKH